MANCNRLKPHLRPTAIAATTAMLAAMQTVWEGYGSNKLRMNLY